MTATALVTGGRGFIASALVPALLADGWEVRSCGRSPRPPSLPAEVDYARLDLAGDDDLARLVAGVDRVFHLAGASSSRSTQEQMERDNAVATGRLLDAVAAAGDAEVFVHMSSTSVYGEEEQLPSPVPETVEPHPSRGYGKAKWMAEQEVWRHAEAGAPVVVLRPVSVHGPGATKLLASALLDVAIERFAGLDTVLVHSVPVEQRLLHLDDLVRATMHLAGHEPARGRAFNVAMPTYPSSHEVARLLAAELGLGAALDDDPDCGPTTEERTAVRDQMLAKGMTDDILFTPERFRFLRKANRNNRLDLGALLGTGFEFRHTDLRDDVAELAAWCTERGWIV